MEREDPEQEVFTNDNEMRGYRTDSGDPDESVTVIVTGDEAGTTLATDTGGGVIAANHVVTKAFGNGSGGVYSIGSDESWVYVYNSSLNSYLDAGLVSASGGYVFAYNCDIRGVAGLKARSGGNQNAEDTGIYVYNSRVTAVYDDEEMGRVYEVSTPEEFWSIGDAGEHGWPGLLVRGSGPHAGHGQQVRGDLYRRRVHTHRGGQLPAL